MEENNNKLIGVLVAIGLVVVCYYLLKPQEPKYIERQFKNGNSIKVEVDDTVTSDNWDCTGNCSGHNAERQPCGYGDPPSRYRRRCTNH